jgi:ankyrin repeat protein
LVETGANVNDICCKKTANTPLHIAFASGDKYLVMYLITHGANLNNLNFKSYTPLAYDKNNLLKQLNLKQGMVSKKKKLFNVYFARAKSKKVKSTYDNNMLLM